MNKNRDIVDQDSDNDQNLSDRSEELLESLEILYGLYDTRAEAAAK